MVTGVIFFCWLVCFWVLSNFYSTSEGKQRFFSAVMLMLVAFIAVISIVGFRPVALVGDTARYLYVFSSLSDVRYAWLDGAELFGNEEILFWPFAGVLKSIGFGGRAWLVTIVVWFFIFTLMSYRRLFLDSSWVIVFPALFLTFHLVFLNSIRQSMVECLVLLAFTFLISRNIKIAFLFLIFASFFHTSAYFAIPLFLLSLKELRVSPKLSIILILFSLAFAPLFSIMAESFFGGFSGGIGDKIDSYVTKSNANEYANLWGLKQFQLMVLVSSIYFVTFSFKSLNKGALLYNWIAYYLLLVLFTSLVPVISGRLMQFLSLVFPIMVWEIVGLFKFTERKRIFIFSSMFSLMGLMVFLNPSARIVLGFDL
jgi:hypothetical protein